MSDEPRLSMKKFLPLLLAFTPISILSQNDHSMYFGNVIQNILDGIVIDNYVFSVASVGASGYESVVAFPASVFRD